MPKGRGGAARERPHNQGSVGSTLPVKDGASTESMQEGCRWMTDQNRAAGKPPRASDSWGSHCWGSTQECMVRGPPVV